VELAELKVEPVYHHGMSHPGKPEFNTKTG